MKSLRSPLGRVRGLGSAKDGTTHWWAQRVTAVALVPLTLWFVAVTVAMVGKAPGDVAAWVADPLHATLLIALLVALFHHAQLGLQVVIEDYVHAEGAKLVLLFAVKGACWVLASIGIVSILKIVTIFPVVMMMRGG